MNLSKNLKKQCGSIIQIDRLEKEIDKLILRNSELTKKYMDVMRFNMDCMHVLTLILEEQDPGVRKKYIERLIENQP